MPLPSTSLPPPSGDDVTSLIKRAKLQEMVPNSDVTFSDADIMLLMEQELMSTIVPLVTSVREEYMVVSKDYLLPAQTAGQVANVTNWLEIPEEATGLRLRDVYVTDNNGNFTNLPRLNPEQVAAFTNMSWYGPSMNTWAGTGYGGFYMMGNRLYIYPYVMAGDRKVRLLFERRPAKLCLTAAAAQVINVTGQDITVGSTTTSWFSGQFVDFIKNATPHDYASDLSATQALYTSPVPLQACEILNDSGSTYTFSVDVAGSVSVGDWMATYGYAPFAQFIPSEAANALVQATSTRLLEALGDREGQALAEKKYERLAHDLLKLISPRVIGKSRKVTNPNSLASNSRMYSGRKV
jgi:hypothetical protein